MKRPTVREILMNADAGLDKQIEILKKFVEAPDLPEMAMATEILAARAMVDAMYLTGREFMPLLDAYRKARAESEKCGL
jgi:hypothetical protein